MSEEERRHERAGDLCPDCLRRLVKVASKVSRLRHSDRHSGPYSACGIDVCADVRFLTGDKEP